ncbi:MAG TPA: alpha-L-fucosidase [Acidimicrobiales bacterium]|nr:alpha-L-fucosidase [Acidimicrobiales bacterium]
MTDADTLPLPPPDLDWFTAARFGLFVHWDHASQQGIEIGWPMVGGVFAIRAGEVSVEQYHSSAATFDPTSWDAPALARLAKQCGVRYAVLTTKHHSGYALWHTKLSDWSIEHSPFGRDVVREFADAMRAEGIKVGFYFSLPDWHHPDYPAFTEEMKPYSFPEGPPYPGDETWERYRTFMFGQLEELLTDYGKVDLIWFDGGWERRASQWRSADIEALCRRLQPGIVINDRLPRAGDYETPEQFVPPAPPDGPWETCMTMNESWSWNPDDTDLKSPRSLVHTLVEVAGRGGNLLLNISPKGDGSIPPEQVERLRHVGTWLARNGASIYDTTPGLEPWQHYGPSTRKGDTVYVHLLARPYDSVTVRGVPVKRVASVTELSSGRALTWSKRTSIIDRLNGDPLGELTVQVPADVVDDDATVLAVQLS